jgi:hypothetical protein
LVIFGGRLGCSRCDTSFLFESLIRESSPQSGHNLRLVASSLTIKGLCLRVEGCVLCFLWYLFGVHVLWCMDLKCKNFQRLNFISNQVLFQNKLTDI